MSPLSLIGVARAPPIKLNRADPLRASLRSVGWHGKLHEKNAISAPSRRQLISRPVSCLITKEMTMNKDRKQKINEHIQRDPFTRFLGAN